MNLTIAVLFTLGVVGGVWGIRDARRTQETPYVILFAICTTVMAAVALLFFLAGIGVLGE